MTTLDNGRIAELEAEIERLREALRVVIERAEGANAWAQWVAEPAHKAVRDDAR